MREACGKRERGSKSLISFAVKRGKQTLLRRGVRIGRAPPYADRDPVPCLDVSGSKKISGESRGAIRSAEAKRQFSPPPPAASLPRVSGVGGPPPRQQRTNAKPLPRHAQSRAQTSIAALRNHTPQAFSRFLDRPNRRCIAVGSAWEAQSRRQGAVHDDAGSTREKCFGAARASGTRHSPNCVTRKTTLRHARATWHVRGSSKACGKYCVR